MFVQYVFVVRYFHPSGFSKNPIDAIDIDMGINENGNDENFRIFRWMQIFKFSKTADNTGVYLVVPLSTFQFLYKERGV